MKLNEKIREHRKKVGLTQEQVANHLGVSTPAVNKWESGATFPDITLLAPLARLLKIDLNTLFAFHRSLSKEEVGNFCNEIYEIVQTKGFPAAFSAASAKLQEYPDCDLLRYSLALLMDGAISFSSSSFENREKYESQFMNWYEQAAASRDEEIREAALSILVNKYLACGKTEKAEELLAFLPDKRAIDKQMLKINMLSAQENYREAAVLAEMKILGDVATLQGYFIKLVQLDLLLNETDAAACAADAWQKIASALDFLEYNRYVCSLQIAVSAKDIPGSIKLMKAMLKAASTPLKVPPALRHLPEKTPEDDFGSRVSEMLLHQFETDKEFAFLLSHPEFQELIARYKKELPLKR